MTKVITLSNNAYDRLKIMKGNKSFSEVILDLTSERGKKSLFDVIQTIKNIDLADNIEGVYKKRNLRKLKKVEL